jgi:hypothetical protein
MKPLDEILTKLKAANPKIELDMFSYWQHGRIGVSPDNAPFMQAHTVDELCAELAAFNPKSKQEIIRAQIAELEKQLIP